MDSVAQQYDGVAARLGGDEFAFFSPCPSRALSDAGFLCEQLLEAIRAPMRIGEVSLSPTASLGLALVEPSETLSALMKHADLALYEVKRTGRDGYSIYDEVLASEHRKRETIEQGLSRALEKNEFFLVYQPQVNMSDESILGYEALMRWRSPSGVVYPDAFISVAEQSGAIIDIDLWGLRTAARRLAAERTGSSAIQKISVNLSPLHFRSDAIVSAVADALKESGVAPENLTLEVTETILLNDWEKVESTIHALKSLGVRIALDDFGTGFSSLSYLQRLPIDQIKIDRSFVRGLEDSAKSRAILSALVDLCNDIDVELLVEGVETRAQMRLLQQMGCRCAQGYLFGRPQRAEAPQSVHAA